MDAYKRRVVSLYRNNTGIAAIADGFWLFEISTGITGHTPEHSDELISFVRNNFTPIRAVSWLRKTWRAQRATLRAQLRKFMEPIRNRPFKAMVERFAKERFTYSWGELRIRLQLESSGLVTRAQIKEIRNMLWAIGAYSIRLCAESLELFDLDKPLRAGN